MFSAAKAREESFPIPCNKLSRELDDVQVHVCKTLRDMHLVGLSLRALQFMKWELNTREGMKVYSIINCLALLLVYPSWRTV